MTQRTIEQEEHPEKRGLEIDWIRTAAGALAAVASAFLLSFLGAAGTIIGAALGSLIVTISSAVFAQGLSSSKRTLAKAQATAARKVGIAQAEVSRAERADDSTAHDSHLEHADERLTEAQDDLDKARSTPSVGWRERLRTLPWKRVLLGAALLFVVAIGVITVFELAAGQTVSSITGGSGDGGTTIGHVSDRGDSSNDDDNGGGESPSPTPSETESPSETPTDTPSPTDTGEPTETPTPTPTPTPQEVPSEEPNGAAIPPGPSTSPTP